MKRLLLSLLVLFSCDTVAVAVVTGGSVSGGAANPPDPVFVRTQGLQTNTEELDRFLALAGSGQYQTDLASLLGASHASRVWDFTITPGAWDGPGGACEPVGATGVGSEYSLPNAATDIFAMALGGYLGNNNSLFASVKTRLREIQRINDFEAADLSGSNQCILDMSTAAYHLVEAAFLMEEAGYSEWTAEDRFHFASWLAREVFPLVDWSINNRKNNWGILGLGSALAISAYADGGIPTIVDWDGTPTSPAAYIASGSTLLAEWMSDNTGDQLDSLCHQSIPARAFGFQASGAFPDDLRRPRTNLSPADIPDCEAASIGAHSTDGGCASPTSCDQNGGHFYSQKSTNALTRVAEIMRRLGDNSVFDLDSHAGGDVDIIAAAKFTSGATYQDWLIQDTTQGYRHVAGEYYDDANLLAARQSVAGPTIRGGRDYAYTRLTHAPGVSYLPNPFVSLAESTDWGPGGSVLDLTPAIPEFTSLSESHGPTSPALPLDTTGWTTIAVNGSPYACTPTGLQNAIDAISTNYTIIDVSACTAGIDYVRTGTAPGNDLVAFTKTNGGTPNNAYVGLVLRGHPTNRTVFRILHSGDWRVWSGGNLGANSGRREAFLRAGRAGANGVLNNVNTWTWTGGQQLNSKSGTVSGTFVGLYPGDVIILKSAEWTAPYASALLPRTPKIMRRVVCSVWSTGAIKGTGCTGDPNGTIRWDRPITEDFRTAGPYTYSSQYTGQQIQQVVRLTTDDAGTYPINTENTYVYMGVENIDVQWERNYAYASSPSLKFSGAVYGWVTNSKLHNASSDALSLGCNGCGAGGQGFGESGAILVSGNTFTGLAYTPRGTANVTTITNSPLRITIDTTVTGAGETNNASYWNTTGIDQPLYFHPECAAPEIRGFHKYTVTTAHTAGIVTVSLDDVAGPAGSTDVTNCRVTLLRQYNSRTLSLDASSISHTIENNEFLNTRIGILMQGTHDTVIGFNNFETQEGYPAQRMIFDHDGTGPFLAEGNMANAGAIVPASTAAAAGPGRGPHSVFAFNSFLRNGVPAASIFGEDWGCNPPNCTNSELVLSSEEIGEYIVWFGNIIEAAVGAKLDDIDIFGKARITGNLWRNFDITSFIEPGGINVESVVTGNSNNVSEMSAGDRARDWPSSLYLTQVPSWWCVESGTFPNVGARAYTSANSPNLPAKARRVGGCTPP